MYAWTSTVIGVLLLPLSSAHRPKTCGTKGDLACLGQDAVLLQLANYKKFVGRCRDTEVDHCSLYREQGYCDNSTIVKGKCKKTCGLCPGGFPGPEPDSPSSVRSRNCTDTEENHCALYREKGYCNTSESVKRECKKTCGFCPGGSPPLEIPPSFTPDNCTDTEENHCALYREKGYCNTSESVKIECKKTCGFCPGGPPPPEVSPPSSDTCADTEENHCALYREKGYCNTSESVKRECKKTCGLCCRKPPAGGWWDTCKDTEEHHCAYYKEKGYCRTSPSVKRECKKSCGLCGWRPDAGDWWKGGCIDTEENHCAFYREQGFCETSESVKTECKRTCGLCGLKPRARDWWKSCKNSEEEDNQCASYRDQGLCETSESVKKGCKKTCGLCGWKPPAGDWWKGCKDTEKNKCALYLEQGNCTTSESVKRECKKTCGLC